MAAGREAGRSHELARMHRMKWLKRHLNLYQPARVRLTNCVNELVSFRLTSSGLTTKRIDLVSSSTRQYDMGGTLSRHVLCRAISERAEIDPLE